MAYLVPGPSWVVDHFGTALYSGDALHGHPTYTNNSRYQYINNSLSGKITMADSDDDTFTATIENSMLYVQSGVIPVGAYLEKWDIQGYNTTASTNGNFRWSIWQATAPADATAPTNTTDVTWNRMGDASWSGTGAVKTYYRTTQEPTGAIWAAGDWWCLTCQPGGTDTSSGSNNAFFATLKFVQT